MNKKAATDPAGVVSTNSAPGPIEAALRKIGGSLDILAEGADASESISIRATIKGSEGRKYRVVIDEMRPESASKPVSAE